MITTYSKKEELIQSYSSSSGLQPSARGSISHSVNALNLSPPGKLIAFCFKNVNVPSDSFFGSVVTAATN